MNKIFKERYKKLGYSFLIDLIGMISYPIDFFFGFGEVTDLVWAPISGYLVYKLYGNFYLSALGFGEELAPFTDVIPTATIAWLYENFMTK